MNTPWNKSNLLARIVAGSACLLASTNIHAQNTPAPAAPAQQTSETPGTDPSAAETPAPLERLPKLDELEIPTVAQLLTGPPRDWVVLDNQDVIVCEPVVPRPDTVNQMRREQERLRMELGKTSGEDRETLRKQADELSFLFVVLPELGALEYRLPVRRVAQIMHHEDLMLRRIEKLLAEKDMASAMELLMRLERSQENWPGLAEMHNNVLFADIGMRVEKAAPEQAMMLLNELYSRAPEHAGLSEKTGQVVDLLARDAVTKADFRKAQFFLNRLNQRYPGHPVFQSYVGELSALAQTRLDAVAQATQTGDHRLAATLVEEAARIWPPLPALKGAHRGPVERFQRLHVGVLSFPRETQAYFVATVADLREQRFLQMPLFDIDRVVDGSAYYNTRFFDEWEPFDLGRRMRFTLKQFKQPYEMQSLLSAQDIVIPLLRRLDPHDDLYDERLSVMIENVSIQSPIQFDIEFRRVPPRIEPLLAQVTLGHIAPAVSQGGFAGVASPATNPVQEEADLSETKDPGGFAVFEQSGDLLTYVRKHIEPDGLPQYHIAQVVEHRYDNYELAVQGLLRGEVAMLPDVPDWIIRRMQADEAFSRQYFIAPYGLPTTHLLQFNPASQPVQVRELRRALAYAIDRDRLLKDIVLRDPAPSHGRLSLAPFPVNSPARNVLVQPFPFDLNSAVAMSLTALRKIPGGIPPLRMIVAPGPVEQTVAEDLIRVWKKIGVNVELVRADDPTPSSWDIMYRTHQMPEPASELWPFLAMSSRARLADLERFPDWFKQDLVDLDRTSDQSRANVALQELHRRLWIDMSLIPLWEVDRHIVIRKNVHGFPNQLMHPYDKVDRWTLDAWYEEQLP